MSTNAFNKLANDIEEAAELREIERQERAADALMTEIDNYGDHHRQQLIAALPATVAQLQESLGRSRTSTMHHLTTLKARGLVWCDKTQWPHVWREV